MNNQRNNTEVYHKKSSLDTNQNWNITAIFQMLFLHFIVVNKWKQRRLLVDGTQFFLHRLEIWFYKSLINVERCIYILNGVARAISYYTYWLLWLKAASKSILSFLFRSLSCFLFFLKFSIYFKKTTKATRKYQSRMEQNNRQSFD